MTNRLLDYQSRVDRLGERSQEVYPIHLRKEVEDFGVKGKALVDYEHQEVCVAVKTAFTDTSNTDSSGGNYKIALSLVWN